MIYDNKDDKWFCILLKYCLFILTRNNRIVGVTNIPKKLPTTEINMAEASLPPTAFVKITAEDTGGGMQLTVANLGNNTKPCLVAFIITSITSSLLHLSLAKNGDLLRK